jgi:RNA recognition motif-containing protein
MKILVRNLPRELTETELHALFSSYGRLQSCNLVIDTATRQSKGFGFVEMPLVNEAKAAIVGLNGKDIAGSKIRVKKADTAKTSAAADK